MAHHQIGKLRAETVLRGLKRVGEKCWRHPSAQLWAGLLGMTLGMVSVHAQLRYEPLRSFGLDDLGGRSPAGGVVLASDGRLYGVTSLGGSNNLGLVYRLATSGGDYRTIKHFTGPEGATPAGRLLDGGDDGKLYGITAQGGDSTNGVIFRLDLASGQFEMLHSFAANRSEGAFPLGGLTSLPDRSLAGVASQGGVFGGGTIFRLSRNGQNFQVLHHFGASTNDGRAPKSRLLLASDGFLYGTTEAGGIASNGVIYRIKPDGTAYEVLLQFQPATSGGLTDFGLLEGPEGWLYGVTASGGPGGRGTVYRFRPADRQLVLLHQFREQEKHLGLRPSAITFNPTRTVLWGTTLTGGAMDGGIFFRLNSQGGDFQLLGDLNAPAQGRFLWGELVLTPDGRLISATLAGGAEQSGTLMSWNSGSGQLEVLHTFQPGGQDGRNPSADLLERADGFLYGTTALGGSRGLGTVFRIRKDLTDYQILHQFGEADQDGENPVAPLIEDSTGILYGTTPRRSGGIEGGTVFKLQSDGLGYQVLKRFTNRSTEGALIVGGLTLTADGWLFGLTVEGGTFDGGTCFRLRPDGSGFTILHAFGEDDDGAEPGDGLVSCGDGFLYGVLGAKGAFAGGSLFRIRSNGQDYQVLYHFGRTAEDGKEPRGGLLCRTDGYLYGTCTSGGRHERGTVYRIRPSGSDYQILYHFNPATGDGVQPWSRLLEWGDGRLYGTATSDTQGGLGTVYSLNPDGSGFTTVLRFRDMFRDGYRPWAGLTAASDGALYGTVSRGGVGDSGRLYRLSNDAWVRFTGIHSEFPASRVRVAGQGVAGARYRIERSPVVGPAAIWTEATVVQADAAGRWSWTSPVPPGVSRAFYRASRVP